LSALPSAKPDAERRAQRERALLEGRLSFAKGAMSTVCTVVQVSRTGAKLNVAEGVALPDEFDVAIPQRNWTGRARLVWRRGAQAGVKFIEARDESETMSVEEIQKRMRALSDELGRLREENQRLRGELKRFTGL
jgi:hypothetical protein